MFRAVTSACGYRFPASFIVRLFKGCTASTSNHFPKGFNPSGTVSLVYKCVCTPSFVIPNRSQGKLNAPALANAFPGSNKYKISPFRFASVEMTEAGSIGTAAASSSGVHDRVYPCS